MSLIRMDFEEIYASGNMPSDDPAIAMATSGLDIRGTDGINVIVEVRGGGVNAYALTPQFSFEQIALDSNRQEILPTAANQMWFKSTVGVWDTTTNRSQVYDDNSYRKFPASGTIEKHLIAFDSPGATAARFLLQPSGFRGIGNTVPGPDPGTIRIRASRTINNHNGRRLGF